MKATIENLIELRRNALLSTYRHYEAARRNRRYQRGIAIFQMLAGVMLGSAFMFLITEQLPTFAKWIGVVLALVSAGLSGVDSYFGFERSFGRHHRAGNAFRDLARACETCLDIYSDGLSDLNSVAVRLYKLHADYSAEVKAAEDLLTMQSDYRKALAKVELAGINPRTTAHQQCEFPTVFDEPIARTLTNTGKDMDRTQVAEAGCGSDVSSGS
jgi:hypothetical protein